MELLLLCGHSGKMIKMIFLNLAVQSTKEIAGKPIEKFSSTYH
nr:MAG TPA: hypothetical protein [Caudoviricetes sp.]